MSRVTEIKQNIKNKNKASIFADGEFLCSVTLETVAKLRVKVGDDIDQDKLKQLSFENDCQIAFSKAVDRVCKGAKTQAQTEKYLFDKGFSTKVVENTIAKMKEYRYVDDSQYVRFFVETYKKTKGKKRIVYELKLKGINQEDLDLVEELLDDQKEAALALAQKFIKSKGNSKDNLQKLYRHLAGKGFSFDVCRYCANMVLGDVDDFDC